MPALFEEWGRRWEEMHPGWIMRLWNEDNMPPLVNQDLYDRAATLCPRHEGQLRADIARYEILYREGGVYLDTDFEPCKPIDGILGSVEAFCAWEIQDQWANNAILGCTPGHEFLGDLITGLPESIASQPGWGPWKVSGPRYLSRVLERHPEVTVFPQTWFYPYGCRKLDGWGRTFSEAYAVHHWQNSRQKRHKPLPL